MKPLLTPLTLLLILGGVASANPPYEKMLETCADYGIKSFINAEIQRLEKKLSNKSQSYQESHFKKMDKDKLELWKKFFKKNFKQKQEYIDYQIEINICKVQFERDPVKFKIKWYK